MSDSEDFMMSDEEEDPFEYDDSDDDQVMASNDEDQDSNNANQHVNLENKYYSAKAIKEDDLQEALKEFEAIIDQVSNEDENLLTNDSIWRFKSIKQSLKIYYQLNDTNKLLALYQDLLNSHGSISNKNYFFTSLDKIIDRYAKSNNTNLIIKFIDISLTSENKALLNSKLLIKLYINKLNFLVVAGPQQRQTKDDKSSNTQEIEKLIDFVITECAKSSNEYIKQHNLLEVYSIQLRLLLSRPDIQTLRVIRQLKAMYAKCKQIEHTVILHPRILGVIKEAGGKIAMIGKNYNQAIETLMESFKNYDEIGSVMDKLRILKSLIILYMLNSKSEINILQSNEIKPYLTKEGNGDDEVILSLLALLNFYEANDVESFNRFFERNLINVFANDNFLSIFKHDILNAIKFKVISNFCKSFKTIKISFLCSVLGIKGKYELEELIFEMNNREILTFDLKFDYVNSLILVIDSNKQKSKNVIPDDLTYVDVITNLRHYENTTKIDNGKVPLVKRFLGSHVSLRNITSEVVEEWVLQLEAAIPSASIEYLTQKEKVQMEKTWSIKKQTVSNQPQPEQSSAALNSITSTQQASVPTKSRVSSTATIAAPTGDESFGLILQETLNSTSANDKLSWLLIKNLKLSSTEQQKKISQANDAAAASAASNDTDSKNTQSTKNKNIGDSLNEWARKIKQIQTVLFNDDDIVYVPSLDGALSRNRTSAKKRQEILTK